MDKLTKVALAFALVLLVIIIGVGIGNRPAQKKRLPATPVIKTPAVSEQVEELKQKKQEKESSIKKGKVAKGIYIPPEQRVSPPSIPPGMEGRELSEDYLYEYYHRLGERAHQGSP